ncbi:MAG: ArdC family protein [Vicinamibacterales bacterium]
MLAYRFADALDRGYSEALTALLRAMSRFHRYSLNNACLIAAQRPEATLVAGFHAWKGLRRFVRRGEQGIAILAPIVRRRKEAQDEDERAVVGFRPAYVFDVSQTDGEPMPEASQPTSEFMVLAHEFAHLCERVGYVCSGAARARMC